MSESSRFFLPGPAWVAPDVLAAQSRQPLAHRSARFRALWESIGARLPRIFRCAGPVVVASGSGTLALETAVTSLAAGPVLSLVNGAFSARWHEIARRSGLDADRKEVPFGGVIEPGTVRSALARRRYDVVTVVHCETSTGVLNPLAEIAAAVREHSDALLLVDAVSSLAGAAVETDEWGLDVVVTASQKALALPPGLSFVSISFRAEERLATTGGRGFYTDLDRYLRHHRDGGPITTPAATLVYALDHQLDRILAEGVEARWERHRAMRDRTVAWATDGGFTAAAPVGARSPTVTTLRPPAGVDADRLVSALAAEGVTIGRGYGPWKGSTVRIGHMGDVGLRDLEAVLEMCEALAFAELDEERSK